MGLKRILIKRNRYLLIKGQANICFYLNCPTMNSGVKKICEFMAQFMAQVTTKPLNSQIF